MTQNRQRDRCVIMTQNRWPSNCRQRDRCVRMTHNRWPSTCRQRDRYVRKKQNRSHSSIKKDSCTWIMRRKVPKRCHPKSYMHLKNVKY